MKIGMIVNSLSITGGCQKLVLRLSNCLASSNEVTVFTSEFDNNRFYPEEDKKFEIVSVDGPVAFFRNILGLIIPETLLKSYFISKKFDKEYDGLIIHDENTLHTLNFIKKGNTKVTWMLNNQMSSILLKYPKNVQQYFSKIKNIKDFVYKIVFFTKFIAEYISLRQAINKVDTIAVYDKFNQKLINNNLRRNSEIVYAGADLEDYQKIKKTKSKNKIYKILSIGILFPHRRYEDIIEAVSILKDEGVKTNLEIIGKKSFSPEYYKFLQESIIRKKLSKNISLIDYLGKNELLRKYSTADAFVFVNEGNTWGISVFEAISARVPVIITTNIGAADIVKNGIHGWVVNPRSPSEIAKSFKEIIRNKKNTNEISNTAFSKISVMLTWEAYAKRMVSTFK